ncbi:protein BFR2-like [Lathyrus oleraceus]|uniref:protein BFR2-like n=1 Tax=Pisum sativum TaxID=3888 RepID=UPI0021D1354A|nr:protein BFR2-like [Pisum sativum]
MQKYHTSDSEHGDEKEGNAPVKGKLDEEMQNADDVAEDISEDGSPTIVKPSTDSPDDKEEDDHSMSNLHTKPAEDEDEEQNNEPENEQNKDMPKTKPTFDASKRTIEPSIGNIVALSLEELKALKKRKSVEYLKAIISSRGSSTEKSPSTPTV